MRKLAQHENGSSSLEYCLLIVLLSFALAVGASVVGTGNRRTLRDTGMAVRSIASASGGTHNDERNDADPKSSDDKGNEQDLARQTAFKYWATIVVVSITLGVWAHQVHIAVREMPRGAKVATRSIGILPILARKDKRKVSHASSLDVASNAGSSDDDSPS